MAQGTLPSRRYNRAWTTQRILNRAPERTRARISPVSVAQQLVNPLAAEIQETILALAHERTNANLATCDLTLPDHAWKIELPPRFEWESGEDQDRYPSFEEPGVWGEIHGENIQLTLAEDNNIQTLFYESLPTRIEYGERQTLWNEVIPTTQVSEFAAIVPESLPIDGPLYITLNNNTVWEEEFKGVLYRSKIHLKGTGVLDEKIEEVVPLRMNATTKTRCYWKTLDEVIVSHLSDTATISIASLPFAEEEVLNSRDIAIDSNGIEQYQFYELGVHHWGSTLVGKRFLVSTMDQVRMGLSQKMVNLEMELLDDENSEIIANAFVFQPWTNYVYVVDNFNLYVYDYSVPFPDVEKMRNDTGDNRLSITFPDNRWMYIRGEAVEIHTRTLDLASVPVCTRWAISYPDGVRYRMGIDGSLWSDAIDGWVFNDDWADGKWKEQKIIFDQLTQNGTYTLELEAKYQEEDGTYTYRTSKTIVFVPAIVPEIQLPLPPELCKPRKIGIDEEGQLWFYNGTSILLGKLFYDYFMVDYEKKTIWLREQYPLVRVVP